MGGVSPRTVNYEEKWVVAGAAQEKNQGHGGAAGAAESKNGKMGSAAVAATPNTDRNCGAHNADMSAENLGFGVQNHFDFNRLDGLERGGHPPCLGGRQRWPDTPAGHPA